MSTAPEPSPCPKMRRITSAPWVCSHTAWSGQGTAGNRSTRAFVPTPRSRPRSEGGHGSDRGTLARPADRRRTLHKT
jgi:hypothetical protein